MVLLILVAILVTFVASLILYARWNYGTLEALGIPVVKPHFLLGSTYNVNKKIVALEDVENFKKFGLVYGVYEGREPQIHICDPEIIKCITVKDFDHFNARRNLEFGSPLLNEMPDFLPDPAKWKLVRQITTPTLSPAKIKVMSVSMKETLVEFVKDMKSKLKENDNKPLKIDVREAIFTMLTDMIMRCVFNIKVENQNDPNNYFAQIVKRILVGDEHDNVTGPSALLPWSLSFPWLNRFIRPVMNPSASADFVTVFKDILEKRRQSGRQQKDYTETVLTWLDRLDSEEFKKLNVTELTILCQALVIFFAGEDQIANVMTNVFLEGSKNPEIEERIFKELDAFLAKHNGQIEYENLNELTYLNACITESLRLVPVFTRPERVCTKDWEKDGLRIKKGMTVVFPLYAIHRNPEQFPNPNKFDPERFMPENSHNIHPYAFNAFGQGPRNCIGIRFATDALLLIASHIYKEFRFKSTPDAEIKIFPGQLLIAIWEPIYFSIMNRKNDD